MAVGSKSGDVRLDVTDAGSIRAGLAQIGPFDALVSAAGKVKFAPLDAMTEADYAIGLKDKLMGQVNLVLVGREFIADGGSFTLTSGVLAHDPIRFGSSASMVNGAIEAFVRAAAIELPRGLRINAVSPGVLLESMPGYGPVLPRPRARPCGTGWHWPTPRASRVRAPARCSRCSSPVAGRGAYDPVQRRANHGPHLPKGEQSLAEYHY